MKKKTRKWEQYSNLPTEEYYEEEISKGLIAQRRYYSIYSLTNKKNGKRYIGRAVNPRTRFICHLTSLESGKHPNKQMLLEKADGYEFEILEDKIKFEERAAKERSYMVKFRTYNPNFGYNTKDKYFFANGKPTKLMEQIMKGQG